MTILQTCVVLRLLACESVPTVDEILARAIETASRAEALNPERGYTFRIVTHVVRLDGEGRSRGTEQQVHENRIVDGAPVLRLVEKNGRELTSREEKREDERERKARAQQQKEPELRFDEDLVGRFTVELRGSEVWRGRASYVLSFEPRSPRVSGRRRLDEIVYRARGRIWIDIATHEIARVEFELSEAVSFGSGLFGKLSELQGEFSRTRVSQDVWMPHHLRVRTKGRAFLKNFHRVEEFDWRDYEAWPCVR